MKPRNTPLSPAASAKSAQSMFAMLRLLSTAHSSGGMHRNGRLPSSSRSTTSTGWSGEVSDVVSAMKSTDARCALAGTAALTASQGTPSKADR